MKANPACLTPRSNQRPFSYSLTLLLSLMIAWQPATRACDNDETQCPPGTSPDGTGGCIDNEICHMEEYCVTGDKPKDPEPPSDPCEIDPSACMPPDPCDLFPGICDPDPDDFCDIDPFLCGENPDPGSDEPPDEPPDDDCGASGGEGANPFNVFDGNVSRAITDLQMRGWSKAPALKWTRYNNSIKRSYMQSFGAGGDWRHSWQYELVKEPQRKGKPRQIQMIYPSGFRRGFTQQKDGSWVSGEQGRRYPEKLKAVGNDFEVTLQNGAKLHFAQTPTPNPKWQYRLKTYSHNERITRFEYNYEGYLICITDSEGKQISLNYSAVTVQTAVRDRMYNIRKTPAVGQWIEVSVPEGLRDTSFFALRLLGADMSPLAVAEIECYGPDSDKPLRGARYRGTGDDPQKAADGNLGTVFAGNNIRKNLVDIEFDILRRLSRVRILPAAGQEAALLNAAVDGVRIMDTTHTCLASASTNDGQSVTYEYEPLPNKVSLEAYPVLARVTYADGTAAKYNYTFLSVTRQPYLEQADDPYYHGRAKRIRYGYAQSHTPYSDGRIQHEINPDTHGIYATLEFDEKQPDVRRVHYSDMRTVTYRVPRSTNGRVTERTDSLGRTTRFEYARKNKGNLRAVTAPNGRRTEMVRDINGRLEQITRSDGHSIKIERDKDGRIRKITDQHGRYKTYERDSKGRIMAAAINKEITGPARAKVGGISGEKQAGERRTKNERDAQGRLTRETFADGTMREYTRDSDGRITALRTARGDLHQYTYTARGRIASHIGPDGVTRAYEYDLQGRLIKVLRPDGLTIGIERNARGLVTRKINPDGSTRSYTYDNYGRKISETDEIGRTAWWEYDALSRLMRHQNTAGGITSYDYTETPGGCGSCSLVSNPSRIIHPDGRIDEFLYDSEGRMIMRSIAVGTAHMATTLYAYDNANNLIQQTNPDGGVIKHTYNIDNRRISTTSPLGHTTYWTYDREGNVLSATDASGRTTDNVYDSNKNLVYTVTADGAETTHGYDIQKRRISTTDATGNTTRWAYNIAGDLVSVTDAAGAETRHAYDKAHRRILTILPDGTRQTWTYNSLGKTAQTVTPDGLKIEYGYDSMGRVIATTSMPAGTSQTTPSAPAITRITYDSSGRRTSITDALNRTTSFEYNARNQVVLTTNPDGTQARRDYDAASGRLTASIDALGHATRYTYTALGEMATLTDANGNTYAFEYDNARRKTATIYPDSTRELRAYDLGGRLVSYTTRAGQVKTITYNTDSRPMAETWAPAGCAPDVSYTYDYMGRLASADNGKALLTYAKDKLGRIISETTDIRALLPHMAPHTIAYLYDPIGRKAGLVYPDGMKVTYAYDSQGRMTKIYNGKKKPLAAYAYDAQGRRSKLARDNGVTTEYAYDLADQVLAIDHLDKTKTSLAYAHYEYDNMGRRTSMTRENNQTDHYRYDATSQLVGVDYGKPSGTVDSLPGDFLSGETFTYDPLGNRVEHTTAISGQNPVIENYTSNNLNQYTRVDDTPVSYDLNGNLTNDCKQSYAYDAQNRLVRVESESCVAEFSYDPGSRCVMRRFHTRDEQGMWRIDESRSYMATYDIGWNIMTDRSLSGTLARTYIHGTDIDEIVASMGSKSTVYPLADALGSVICLTDRDDKAQTTVQYTATGEPITRPTNYRLLFTGREWLEQIALNEHRNRYYSTILGRWITADPLGFEGGVNLMVYVNNAPTMYTDPTGELTAEDAVKKAWPAITPGDLEDLVKAGGMAICIHMNQELTKCLQRYNDNINRCNANNILIECERISSVKNQVCDVANKWIGE